MRSLTAFPTWLLAYMCWSFGCLPALHPWRKLRVFVKIDDWYFNRTQLCKQFDLLYWMVIIAFVAALIIRVSK